MNCLKSNPIYITDHTDGDNNEAIVKAILEQHFDTILTKLDKYHQMDFRDINGTYYEIKSRNNEFSKYPTTMIGFNKLLFQHKLDCPVRFIFKFTDGLYYYEYDKSRLDEIIVMDGGRNDRGQLEIKKHAYINIKYLTKI